MSSSPHQESSDVSKQTRDNIQLVGRSQNTRGIVSTPSSAKISSRRGITAEARERLANDYAVIADLLSEFSSKVTQLKDNMEGMIEAVPAQTRLCALWEEQAREWSNEYAAEGPSRVATTNTTSQAEEGLDSREGEDSIIFL